MNQVTQTFYSNLEQFQAAGTSRVRNYLFHEYGYFFQDDWKIRRNLTLNIGLRYEFNGVPFERDGLQGTLDKAAQINASSRLNDLTVQRSKNWYNNDYNNFAPRFGFAWDPAGDGKTAIRGGYGIFYDRIIGATTSYVDSNTPGFSQVQQVFPNSAAGSDVRAGDAVPLPQRPPAPQLRLPNNRQNTIGLFVPNLRTGYFQHYSLTLQRELFRNAVIEAGYVGTRGVKLFMDLNPNQRKIEGDFLKLSARSRPSGRPARRRRPATPWSASSGRLRRWSAPSGPAPSTRVWRARPPTRWIATTTRDTAPQASPTSTSATSPSTTWP